MSASDTLREEARALDRLLADKRVQEAMRYRCEAQGHQWANGVRITAYGGLRALQTCDWCGEDR